MGLVQSQKVEDPPAYTSVQTSIQIDPRWEILVRSIEARLTDLEQRHNSLVKVVTDEVGNIKRTGDNLLSAMEIHQGITLHITETNKILAESMRTDRTQLIEWMEDIEDRLKKIEQR